MSQKPHSLEYTYPLKDGRVFHYTCNAPEKRTLDSYGIDCIGISLGCEEDREVVLIPAELFKKKGIKIPTDLSALTITAENLLRRLE